MNETRTGGSKSRKALSATLAVVMAFVMLLSGTLAYFYQTNAVNKIEGTEVPQVKKVIGHDDFTQETTNADGSITYNKDVYVENVGNVPVYVRVKLVEDLTFGSNTISATTHIPTSAEKLSVGTKEKDGAAAGDLHQYFTLKFGNEGDTSRTTFLSGNAAVYADAAATDYKMEALVAQDFSKKNYDSATETNADTKKYIRGLAYAPVITMKEYLDNNKTEEWRQDYTGWVIDNCEEKTESGTTYPAGDGWAYYSKMLNPGETTPVLLNGVIVDGKLYNQGYTYNIDVKFESVDSKDLGVWTSGATTAEGEDGAEKTDVSADQVASYGAKKLIEYAGKAENGAYNGTTLQTAAIIADKKADAQSEAAKALYDDALNLLNNYAKTDQNFGNYLAKMYMEMADETEELKAANDPSLTQEVIKIESGAVTKKPDGMEDALAKEIMKVADLDVDNTLTGEEALRYTDLTAVGDTITSLAGLNVTNFKHLRGVHLWSCSSINTLDTTQLVYTENGEKKGVYTLDIYNSAINTGSLDLTPLADTLKHFSLQGTYGEVKGLENLQGLNSFSVITEGINAMAVKKIMDNSTDTLKELTVGCDLKDDDGQPLADFQELPFTLPKGLRKLFLRINNMKGTYSIKDMPSLNYLEVYSSSKIECSVENCPKLSSVFSDGNVEFTALPNGVVVQKPAWLQ